MTKRKPITISLDSDILERLEMRCERIGQTKGEIIRSILYLYLQQGNTNGSRTS